MLIMVKKKVDGIRTQLHDQIKIIPNIRPHEGESKCISFKDKSIVRSAIGGERHDRKVKRI